ncbi:DUF2071 domain-containing protein [Chitinophaga niabensis]|uniref:DUF2071 domain-containing protein n=1 Tax=Chitinophaga niabensis TaxID=536979 RepID=UPI0031BBCC70
MNSLRNHPFAVEAFFEHSLVLTFAVPKNEIKDLLPPCLEPDTFQDEWAFIAVALVKTKDLRPKGFPAFMGNDFFLIGYRIFVRYTNNKGKRLRGLYILRSETNKKKMAFLGNIFTHYRYITTAIQFSKQHISSPGLTISINTGNDNTALPTGSPFSTWQEARRFAGPLPFTFSYNEKKKEVVIIEGVRENWTPRPVEVLTHDIAFLKEIKLNGLILANAFMIEDIPYYWKKGKTEIWQP